MDLKTICEEILKNEGYAPLKDDEGDIYVKVQGVTFFVIIPDDDTSFVRVWLPKFYRLQNEQESARAYRIINQLNKEYRTGKIFIDEENELHCSAEFFIDPNDVQLKDILIRMFNILLAMRMELLMGMRSN